MRVECLGLKGLGCMSAEPPCSSDIQAIGVLEMIREFPKIRGTGVPCFGVFIIRILLFRVLY